MPAHKNTKQIRPGKAPPTPSQSQAALQAALKAVEQNKRLGITPKATPKMAKGGLAAGHKAANGVAKKGKTKGMMVKMCSGGKMKKGR